MSCEDLSIGDVLQEAIGKLKEFEKRIDEKINSISSGGSGGFGGIFQGGNPLDGMISKLKGKILNSKFGAILSKAQGIFGGGFNLNFFLNEVIKEMYNSENRSRLNRSGISRGPGKPYNFNDLNTYEDYEELSFIINNDPDDLIYISKIATDELSEIIEDKILLLDELDEMVAVVTSELLVLDADPLFYQVDNNIQLDKISSELLDAIIELGSVDTALNSSSKFFDSNSFATSQRHIENSIDEISPQTNFNEYNFRKSIARIHSIVEEIKEIDQDILKRKTLIEKFLVNFKNNYYDLSSDDFLIKEIIKDIRKVKDSIDGFLENNLELNFDKRNSILVSLFAILTQLSATKQSILKNIETIENIDPFNDPEDVKENFKKYEELRVLTENLTFNPDSTALFLDEVLKLTNLEEFNVIRKDSSDKNILVGYMNDVFTYSNGERSLMEDIKGNFDSYYPRENPDMDSLLEKLQNGSMLDIIASLKKGDWKGMFDLFLGGKFGGNDISNKIQCILGSGQNLFDQTTNALTEFDRIASSFDSTASLPFSTIEQAKESAKKDLDKEKEKIGKSRESLQNAISKENSGGI